MKNKYMWILSLGHVSADLNQGALPAVLPFLIAAAGLSYSQAAGLAFAVSLSASVTQPAFGLMADKLSKTWLMPIGVLLAGLGLSSIGIFPNSYWIMFLSAIICGIGIAAFHPEGARMANMLSGKKKSGSMSIFSVGGNIGFSIGPMIATPALIYLGLKGSLVFAIPAILVCMALFITNSRMTELARAGEAEEFKSRETHKNEWGKFGWLGVAIISRSVVAFSMNTFIPLYWLNVLHQTKAVSGTVLSFMFFFGAIATVAGGHLADRIGLLNTVKISWIILIFPIIFLTRITNPVFAMLMLIPISFGNYMMNTPMILLGQKYLSLSVGFASGITMGLAVSIGGLMAPVIGNYADNNGLIAAFRLLVFLPLIGTLVAFTIKPPNRK